MAESTAHDSASSNDLVGEGNVLAIVAHVEHSYDGSDLTSRERPHLVRNSTSELMEASRYDGRR